jgi:hypothetical protein
MQVSFCGKDSMVLANSSATESKFFDGQELTQSVHVISTVDLTCRSVEFYKPERVVEEVKQP